MKTYTQRIAEDRIKPADIPPAHPLKCLKRLGAESTTLLRGIPVGTATAK
jgi:hypothetical protein